MVCPAPCALIQSLVRQLLNTHGGALHFRNLPLRTADDYSRFLHALAEGAGWRPHVDKGLRVLRRVLAKNVATANDGPPEAPIGLHNEYGLSNHYPSYISFFCLSAPDKGGETPIASSLEVHDCLKRKVPEFIEAIKEQGIAFGIHYPVEQIVNSMAGNNLYAASAFGPSDGTAVDHLEEDEKRRVAEENVRALSAAGGWQPGLTTGPHWQRRGFEAQWQADGTMLVHQRVPGVRLHPNFQRPTYFTNLLNGYMWAEEHGSLDPPHVSKKTTLGGGLPFLQVPPKIVGEAADGSEDVVIPGPWIEAVKAVSKEVAVAVQWQIGDVLLLDNLAVQHGRNPWQGDRRLLASLWDAQKHE